MDTVRYLMCLLSFNFPSNPVPPFTDEETSSEVKRLAQTHKAGIQGHFQCWTLILCLSALSYPLISLALISIELFVSFSCWFCMISLHVLEISSFVCQVCCRYLAPGWLCLLWFVRLKAKALKQWISVIHHFIYSFLFFKRPLLSSRT